VFGVLSLAVMGCARQEFVHVIEWQQPDFAIRKHYAISDVVSLKPAYQTVVCLGCDREDAFSDSDRVFWISLRTDVETDSIEQSTTVTQQKVIKKTLDSKLFSFDSYQIIGDLRPLQHILDIALKNPQQPIRIVGHTDSIGTMPYNLSLSARRAKIVGKWLTNKGVNPERITIEGRGEGEPIASNKTKKGRALNRRTEMFMTIVVSE
jgi:outer membrane protein OmpA-like peptidoglycan-associated protein